MAATYRRFLEVWKHSPEYNELCSKGVITGKKYIMWGVPTRYKAMVTELARLAAEGAPTSVIFFENGMAVMHMNYATREMGFKFVWRHHERCGL